MATITVNSSYQQVSYSNWSKVISGTTYNFTLTTYAKLNGQNTDTKTSTIELKSVLTLKQPAIYVSVSSGTSVLNGTSKSFGSTTFNRGDTTLQTKTITITHSDDGTSPTQSVSASWAATNTGNGSTSGSIKAPKMNLYPTIKTPYSFNATLENGNVVISNPRIDFNTDDSYASMNVYCAIFPASATEYESTTPYVSYRTLTSDEIRSGQFVFDDLSTTEKNGLAQASKYTNQLAVKYVLKTGTNKYSTMNANMDVSNVNPTFTTSYREQNGAVRTLLGEQPDTEITKVIKNASKVRLTVTAIPKMYAEISNITLMHNNKDIQPISHSGNVYVFDVDVLDNTFRIMVIDSRGNGVNGTPPAYVDEQKTLINYTPININQAASIVRSTGQHKNNIVITFESPYTSIIDTYNNEYHVKYKLSSSQTYIDITSLATVSDGKLFMTNVEIGNDDVIPYTESANVDLFISDKLGEDTETKTVLSAVSTFEAGKTDLQVNGDLFIANTNRQNAVNVLSTINGLMGDVADLSTAVSNIIDSGYIDTGNTGYYIKFADGTMITRHTKTGTASITTAWGNGYTTGAGNTIDLGNYPMAFLSGSTPYIWVTIVRDDNNYWMASTSGTSETNAGKTSLLRFTSATVKYRFRVLAIGRWK